MYSLRNKNKERFRTQALRETADETPSQSQRPNYLFHSPPAQTLLSNSRQSQESSLQIVKNLQKHIEYIEKKLAEAESQKQNIKNNSEWLRSQLDQKDAIIERQLNKIKQNQKSSKDILLKYENLKTDVENYRLQQKVEKLNREINQQKELQRRNQSNYTRKKDKFSSAFLPSPFGSPKHYSEKPSEIFQSIIKDQISDSSYISKNPFEESLWSQWKKLKNQKVKRQKDLATLTNNNQKLKNELLNQRKQFQKVKMQYDRRDQKSTNEISKLKARIVTYIKDQKLLMSKLKINEEKMMELSLSMKQKGESDGDRFFAHSSALQLQQIFEKISHNLDLDSSTIDLTIQNNKKIEAFTQTNGDFEESNLKKIEVLQGRISQLELEMIDKQKQWVDRLQQSNNSYMSELKDASDMMDLYKCRIQHLSKQIADQQTQINHQSRSKEVLNKKVSQQVGVSCDFSQAQTNKYDQLIEKIKLLMQVKEEQSDKIASLLQENEQLAQKIEEDQAKQHIDRLRWIEQTKQHYQISLVEENREIVCQNCIKWKELLSKSQLQHLKLVENMSKKISQSEHFQHSLQDALSKYENLQNETHQEIKKLKSQLIQRQRQIQGLAIEIQQKNSELAGEKDQIDQLRKTITKLEHEVEIYQEKIEAGIIHR